MTECEGEHVGIATRVNVITRGQALMLAVLFVGLARLCQSPPVPSAFAAIDGFDGHVEALAPPTEDWMNFARSDGTYVVWDPRSSDTRVGASLGREIYRATFAPDGSMLAVADLEGVVSLWDMANWRRRAEFPPRVGTVCALAFSGDAATLASADGSGVRFWNVATADPDARPYLDLAGVGSLAFGPDGRTLAVGTRDGTVRLWDSFLGCQVARFQAHPAEVKSLEFSADGRVLATSSPHDTVARLWDTSTGLLVTELNGRSTIQAMAFSPGDRVLATAGMDGIVRFWDHETGDSCWAMSEGDGPVSTLAFSVDGATLACGSFGAVRLYHLDDFYRSIAHR